MPFHYAQTIFRRVQSFGQAKTYKDHYMVGVTISRKTTEKQARLTKLRERYGSDDISISQYPLKASDFSRFQMQSRACFLIKYFFFTNIFLIYILKQMYWNCPTLHDISKNSFCCTRILWFNSVHNVANSNSSKVIANKIKSKFDFIGIILPFKWKIK